MNVQKFKVMPAGGYGIDWRGSGSYALTFEKAVAAAVKFLQSQTGRDPRMMATSCLISHRKPGTEGNASHWRHVATVTPTGEVKDTNPSFNPLVPDARLALVKSVSQAVFDNFESFREGNLGADLAYLMIAIVDDNWEHVDWTVEGYGDKCELLEALKELYPDERHNVWLFIIQDKEAA